jgi:hypothetical protein
VSFLTKEQIIAAQDRQFMEVDVPEWGGKVRLVSFDADQAMQHSDLMQRRKEGKPGPNPISLMLAASIVDADGSPLFKGKDIEALGKKSPAVLMRLVEAVSKLNNLGKDETPEGEKTEEEGPAGNSGANQSAA